MENYIEVALVLLADQHQSMPGDGVTMKIADAFTVAVTMADGNLPPLLRK